MRNISCSQDPDSRMKAIAANGVAAAKAKSKTKAKPTTRKRKWKPWFMVDWWLVCK